MALITQRRKPETKPETALEWFLLQHLQALAIQNYSEHTVRNRLVHIGYFVTWAQEHGLREPIEVTRPVLERYQRHLFYYRKKNGEPLSCRSQHARLVPLRVWFRWLTRQNTSCITRPQSWSCHGWAERCQRTSSPSKRSSA